MWKKTLFITAAIILVLGITVPMTIAGEKDGAFLGVYLNETQEKTAGAVLSGIIPDSPAAKAGLTEGDVITGFNSKTVASADDLRKLLQASSPNDEAKIKYLRAVKENNIKVTLAEPKKIEKTIKMMHPGMGMTGFGGCGHECKGTCGFLGVVLQDMSGQLAEYFGVKSGALIGEVVKDSPAEKAGLKAGDIIQKFDDKRVDDAEDLKYYIKKSEPKKEYPLSYSRKGAVSTIKVTLGECSDCGDKCSHSMQIHCGEIMRDCLKGMPMNIETIDKDGKKIIKIQIDEDENEESDDD